MNRTEKKEQRRRRSTRQLMGIDRLTGHGVQTPEGELSWPLDAAAAQAALPSTLTPLSSRRVVFDGKPCYEFACADGGRQVKITVDAQYGRELDVEVEKG